MPHASLSQLVCHVFFARLSECSFLSRLRLRRRRRISGPINGADLPRKQMIPPSDRGPIVLARRWRTMASCLRATVVNSPPPPVASPSAAIKAPHTNPSLHSHAALLRGGSVGHPLVLRGCCCAGLRRTRADIDDSRFHQRVHRANPRHGHNPRTSRPFHRRATRKQTNKPDAQMFLDCGRRPAGTDRTLA